MNSSYLPNSLDFAWRQTPVGPVLESTVLARLARNGVTTRSLRFRDPSIEHDYEALAGVFGVAPPEVIRVRQVHGKEIVLAAPGIDVPVTTDADAIICTDITRVASVRIADCVPVLIADEGRELVAAVHAGWRGTAAGVSGATVDAIRALGIAPERLVAAIGPSIGPCCYQVSAEVFDETCRTWPAGAAWFTAEANGRWKLDLWRANREQLIRAGVRPSAISVAGICTADHLESWFSHRKEGAETGRMVAAIRLT